VYVAYTAVDPTTQGAFVDQVVNNITEIEPGHACYKIDQLEGITAGTNATFQLEYWADFEGENDGRNQSFFACADVVSALSANFGKFELTCGTDLCGCERRNARSLLQRHVR
jgi:hypothetical protein